jgi:hypothetical protein
MKLFGRPGGGPRLLVSRGTYEEGIWAQHTGDATYHDLRCSFSLPGIFHAAFSSKGSAPLSVKEVLLLWLASYLFLPFPRLKCLDTGISLFIREPPKQG